jgi:medium-chain acyl-[acyl-carrier-protein] hydrolase
MPISPNFTSIYSHEWDINFTQCAPNSYLKYVDLCNLLQLTAAEHSILGGLSFNDLQEHNQAWVLSKILIEIDELPKWQDKIVVKTWIESMVDSRSTRNIEMYLNGKKIAGATSFWVVFNTEIRKAQSLVLPHEQYEKFPDNKATAGTFSRINIIQETEKIIERNVVLSDLDIVNHVNNVKYLEWCLDTLNPESILTMGINNIEMNFLRELNLNDKVAINTSKEAEQDYFSVTKDGKICFALLINWK